MESGAASVCSIFKWFLEAISQLETTQIAQAAHTHLLSYRVFPDVDFPVDGNNCIPFIPGLSLQSFFSFPPIVAHTKSHYQM